MEGPVIHTPPIDTSTLHTRSREGTARTVGLPIRPSPGHAPSMNTTEVVASKKAKPRAARQLPSLGTERWPKECVAKGNFFLVPSVLFRDLKSFSTKNRNFRPHHLWLLLALQAERFRDRPPRYYWEAIASWCGFDRNTVRRWGYELKDMGLLEIEECKKLEPGHVRRPGYRNERNRFKLEPFEKKVLEVHTAWDKQRRKRHRTGDGHDESSSAAEAP